MIDAGEERKDSLSSVLTTVRFEDPPVEPKLPFPVEYDNGMWMCEQLEELTCRIKALDEHGGRITVRHEYVKVSPKEIQWVTAKPRPKPAPSAPLPIHQSQPYIPPAPPAPLPTLIVSPAPSQEPVRSAGHGEEVMSPAIVDEDLKLCPTCGKKKPRAMFPPGKGFKACFDCKPAASAATATQTTAIALEKPRKKRKVGKRGRAKKQLTVAVAVAKPAHKNNGAAPTFKELLGGVRKRLSDRDEIIKSQEQEIAALQAEKADLYAQLQELVS